MNDSRANPHNTCAGSNGPNHRVEVPTKCFITDQYKPVHKKGLFENMPPHSATRYNFHCGRHFLNAYVYSAEHGPYRVPVYTHKISCQPRSVILPSKRSSPPPNSEVLYLRLPICCVKESTAYSCDCSITKLATFF